MSPAALGASVKPGRSFSLVAEARRAYRKTAAYRAYLEKRKSSLDYAWSQFRSHARRRGKEVAISKDDYCTLVKMPCAYCSERPPAATGRHGIDREDNGLGYVQGNCVPCCTTCNMMKWKLSRSDFVDHARRLSSFASSLRRRRGSCSPCAKQPFVTKSTTTYTAYMRRAARKDIPFELSKDGFSCLRSRPCA